MLDTLVAGGPVMVPIGILSLVALAVFFERVVSLRRSAVVPRAFLREFFETVRTGDLDRATAMARSRDAAAARILDAALTSPDTSRAGLKERLEEVGRREAAELERWIPVLGTIASVAPLLGLLGTVLGMILTFQALQTQGGAADVGDLAGGISQALVTTFAGLSVGIPSVMANRFLLSRVDARLLELEAAGLTLLDLLAAPEQP